MPDSPLYERLTAVANLNTADQGTSDMDEIRSHIETAKGIVARVRQNPGITGMIKTAIERKLDSYIALFEMHEKNLTTLRSNHEAACNAMTEAVASFGTISKSLISHHEMEEWHKGKEVSVAGETIPCDTYYANLMEERNRQREEAAGAILDKMNNALNEAAEVTVDSGNQGDGGGSGSAGSGGIGGGSHSSASSPRSMGAGGPSGGAAGSALPFGRFHPGDDGTLLRTTHDPRGGTGNLQWPRDMLKYPINARMTPDGPVGGYVPADVLNADDPRWRADYSPPGLASGSGAKATGIAGGVLGAGALAAKGAGNLNAALPLGAARAGAPGSALRPGTMPYGYGGAGCAGSSKEKENSRDTKGYKVVRVDDDASRSVDSSSFGAGDAASLRPLDTDDGDAW